MPGAQDRQQLATEELQEWPITGPFGGVQSELSLTQIEPYGFANTPNIIFRQGVATVRPGYTALPLLPNPQENILGIADFFNVNGVNLQVVFTPTRLFLWNPTTQTWTEITGAGFTNAVASWSWDVVNYKLCFDQGFDKIWFWDGITANYLQTSAAAPAASYIAEIGLHLMALNTVEGGVSFPNRYHWSGIGDPTDWSSFSSGLNDQLNNLGPGSGLIKIGQQGFGLHQNGIVQVVPTGIGTAPFAFYPIINASQGLPYPSSLDHLDIDGIEMAVYHTYDNVVVFNGSSIQSIGDAPIDGRRRLGARSRILADIRSVNPNTPFGFVTYSINGNAFKAYWLIIPGKAVWIYNFDEGNWTTFQYDRVPSVSGIFVNPVGLTWAAAIGTWAAQNYSWASLLNNQVNGFAIGFADGTTGYIDFSNFSESPWSIVSAKHTFGDRRHKKAVKKFRLVVRDLGNVAYTVTLTNEVNTTQTKTVTLGSGSGDDLSAILDFNLPGLRLQWTVSGPVKAAGSFVEFAPMFDTGGEQRGGTVDNN